MYGQSDGMGTGRWPSYPHVFLCHERYETQTWFIKEKMITGDGKNIEQFPVIFFYRIVYKKIKKNLRKK